MLRFSWDLGVSHADETTQSSLSPHFPPSPLPTTPPSLPPSSEDSLATIVGMSKIPALLKALREAINIGKSKIPIFKYKNREDADRALKLCASECRENLV